MQVATAIDEDYMHVVNSTVIEQHCIQSVFANMGFGENRMRFSKTRACDACNYWPTEKRIPLSALFSVPGRQLPGPLLWMDFVEFSRYLGFGLLAVQRWKTLHNPTRLEKIRGMHWGHVSITEDKDP